MVRNRSEDLWSDFKNKSTKKIKRKMIGSHHRDQGL